MRKYHQIDEYIYQCVETQQQNELINSWYSKAINSKYYYKEHKQQYI